MYPCLALVIPALNPPPSLAALIQHLRGYFGFVIVVNDGSDPSSGGVFAEVARWAKVVNIPKNEGKGAAIKAGLAALSGDFPALRGAVFADADGQHEPSDIIRVAERFMSRPDRVVFGSRQFHQPDVPLRSRFGNVISRLVTNWVLGIALRDTQTGLRAVPASLLAAIQRLPSSRYDFEAEMLLLFKHSGIAVDEIPIRTIYTKGNSSSHFRPLVDSGRITFLLVRFLLLSLTTAAVDNAVYLLMVPIGSAVALIVARIAAICIQYPLARRAVFVSSEPTRLLLPRYLLLVSALTGLTAILLECGLGKIISETVLFPISFWLQREFVFRSNRFRPTDWNEYYRSIPWTARHTRRYTNKRLLAALHLHPNPKAIVELGGANSCFVASILTEFPGASYCAVDTNDFGLQMLRVRFPGDERVQVRSMSIQDLPAGEIADTVVSVGLIEHFAGDDLRNALAAHFRILAPGGLAVISFPTPTVLYSVTRALAELVGVWRFPDEIPLWTSEVDRLLTPYGLVVHEETLWPLVLTQHLVVVRAYGRE